MKIKEFDIENGIFQFELSDFKTSFHTHPAIEIVYSKNGGIEIETPNGKIREVCFAIIDANISHKVIAKTEEVQMLLIEGNSEIFQKILLEFEIKLIEGVYSEIEKRDRNQLMHRLLSLSKTKEIPITINPRIHECLKYLNSVSSEYKEMLKVMASKTNLSESRISHLFKDEMGLSIKKYLVWSRLKKTFKVVLSGEMNMYEASIQSGFYDQAHLSKAFKQMLGMSPSKVYNSRMLQD